MCSARLSSTQLSPIFSSTGWFIDSLRIGAVIFQVSTCAFVACELLFTSGSSSSRAHVGFGWSWLVVTAVVAVVIVARALAAGLKRWSKKSKRARKHKPIGERIAEMVTRNNPLYDEAPVGRL
jgi:Na+/pantothenate symporter